MNVHRSPEHGIIAQQALVAGVLFAVASFLGVVLAPETGPQADMRIEPQSGVALKGGTFPITIIVNATTPVNVFKGELRFNPAQLRVQSIDYNVSIADLWAERPWYENGEGTINFIGGTTREGGFLGTGSLMTVHFETVEIGETTLQLKDSRILAHDGLGTYIPLGEPIDALFTIEKSVEEKTVATPLPSPATIAVVQTLPNTDLNGDGQQGIADLSIFMMGMVTKEPALDFNGDGDVGAKDLSILLSAH